MTKEELKNKKDEMKNKISMELKSSITQQGFEIFCKNLAKLEKENAELKRQLSDIVECFQSASSGDDFEMAETAREIMEILDISCYRHGKVVSKLTKAKELLKRYVKIYVNPYPEEEIELREESEQFIKELNK